MKVAALNPSASLAPSMFDRVMPDLILSESISCHEKSPKQK